MTYDYVFLLRQGRTQPIRQSSFLLCFLSILAFIFFQWRIGRITVFESVSILMVIGAMLFDHLYRKEKSHQEDRESIPSSSTHSFSPDISNRRPGNTNLATKAPPFSMSLLVTGICWIGMPVLNWLCLAFFLLCVLEYLAGQSSQISLGSEIIISQGFLKRKYPWTRLNNVVLKDGLLTLDFKNNRLIQKEINDNNHWDEDLFNRYCQLKISEFKA